ncbi:MAG: hypothetical protein WBA10_18490 [Elainellaceae cyanobacterium]
MYKRKVSCSDKPSQVTDRMPYRAADQPDRGRMTNANLVGIRSVGDR